MTLAQGKGHKLQLPLTSVLQDLSQYGSKSCKYVNGCVCKNRGVKFTDPIAKTHRKGVRLVKC